MSLSLEVAAAIELPCAEDVPVFGGGAVELLSDLASIDGNGSVEVQGVVLSAVNGLLPDKSVDILDFLGKQEAVPDIGLFRVKEGALLEDNCGSAAEETFFKGGDCVLFEDNGWAENEDKTTRRLIFIRHTGLGISIRASFKRWRR